MGKITPLGHRVLAKQVKSSDKTASGLYLPDNAQEKPDVAEIVAVGSEVKSLKAGDRVIYKTYSSPIKIDGEEYLILGTDHDDKEGDVIAFISK